MSQKPNKRRVSGGRVTPKGTRPEGYQPETTTYTGHDSLPPSPTWVPVLMFALLGLGVLVILLNYVGSIWDTSNPILLLGLGMILGGIITATQYR
jgi:Cell division protein CrgA